MKATMESTRLGNSLLRRMLERFLRFMMGRVRVLPLVVFCAVTLLSVKVTSLWTTINHKESFLSVGSNAVAQEMPSTPAASKAEERPEQKSEAQKPEKEAPSEEPRLQKLADLDPAKISAAEYSALQSIAEKKETAQKAPLDPEKEATLKAIESRIDEKAQKLKESFDKLNRLLKNVEEQENTNTMRLVKIAEGMKPTEAAKILEGLNFEVLLEIMAKIKENKAAPILSKMDPQKASYLMTELAVRKKLLKKKEGEKSSKAVPAPAA